MKNILSLGLLASLFAFTACGGGESMDTPAENAESATPANDIRTINIIGVDEMKYVVSEASEGITTGEAIGDYLKLESITASAGEEIRINLTTESEMPAIAMAHNFALLTAESDVDAFINASITARDTDYIAPDMQDMVIANTTMIGGGESDEVTFTAPTEPGEYTFVCSFPGHYTSGMVGVLIVE
jgi:azurin